MPSNNRPTSDFTKIAIIVCVFVMMREFRPIEPFFTSYLTSPEINLTTDQVNEEIYPIGTYFSFAFAILVFLTTDYLRYKPVIILDGLTGILTYLLLLGHPTRLIFIFEQMFYGFFYASDIASNTYLYAKIEDPSQYQKITGYVRASSLTGRCFSGIFAQLTVSFHILENKTLLYASIAGMVFVTFWSFIIPSVDHSIYFHRVEKHVVPVVQKEKDSLKDVITIESGIVKKVARVEGCCDTEITVVKSQSFGVVCHHIWDDFYVAYTNLYVLKWTVWWTFCLCGYYFIVTYSQVLWQDIANEHHHGRDQYYALMNGAVESISTITSAVSAYLISRTSFNWRAYGDYVLFVVTLVLSSLILSLYFCHSLLIVYATYVAYSAVFHTMLTIAQSEVAQHLRKDSYGLIFGFNQFVALGLGSVVTYAIIEGHLIHFTTRQQFLFYGVYYFAVAISVLFKIVRDICVSL